MSKRNKVRSAKNRGLLLSAFLEDRVLTRLLLREEHRRLVDARIIEFRQKAAYFSELVAHKSETVRDGDCYTRQVIIDWSQRTYK